MAEHIDVILQLWSETKPASRHQSCQLSADLGLMALVLKQYPEYDTNSLSFVGCTIPLSTIELLSFSRTSTGMVISTQVKRAIQAEPIVDKAVQSHQEELVTLEMCCSLIDCTLQPGTKVDIVPDDRETEQNYVNLLLDILSNTTQAVKSTDIDLCEDSIQYLSSRGNEHSQVIGSSDMSNLTTDTSEDDQTTSTIPTSVIPIQISQDELICYRKPSRTLTAQNETDPVVHWNEFAESHGATPRAKVQANNYSTMPSYPDTFLEKDNKASATATTGGYLTDSKRNYDFIEQDRSLPRGSMVAKRRNRNTPKTASHLVARLSVIDTYVQPFYSQSSTITAKHGSFW